MKRSGVSTGERFKGHFYFYGHSLTAIWGGEPSVSRPFGNYLECETETQQSHELTKFWIENIAFVFVFVNGWMFWRGINCIFSYGGWPLSSCARMSTEWRQLCNCETPQLGNCADVQIHQCVKLCKWSNIGQYRDTNRVQMCAHCAMHSVHGCQLCNHCSVFFLLCFVQGLVQKYFV